MKKYLMIGFAAVAMASCTNHDFETMSQEEYDKYQIQQSYNKAFVEGLLDGKAIASNQDWGFGATTRAFTRAAAEFGWELSEGYEAEFSKEYFEAIQENMPEGGPVSGNSDYEFLSTGPFEFSVIFSNTSSNNHIGYYYYRAEDGIASRTEVQFIEDVQNISNYFQYAQPKWDNSDDWKDPQPQSGYQIWSWGATKVHAKVFTINVPAGYRVGFWIENFKAGYPRFYSNQSLNPEGLHYSAVVEQVEGTLAGTFLVGLEDWLKSDGGDNDCNDIIMSVNKGTTPPIVIDPDEPDPSTSEDVLRIIAEDLSASGASDFDFNDVVLDVTYGNPATVMLVAAGGTLELKVGSTNGVGGVEVHEALLGAENAKKNEKLYKMVSPGGDVWPVTAVDITSYLTDKDIRNATDADKKIRIEVYKQGASKDYSWNLLTAPQGEPACKLAVDNTFNILRERQTIKGECPLFVRWATENNFTSKWW